jgi:hypothetical protein
MTAMTNITLITLLNLLSFIICDLSLGITGHSLVKVNSNVYLFGGSFNDISDTINRQMFRLNNTGFISYKDQTNSSGKNL